VLPPWLSITSLKSLIITLCRSLSNSFWSDCNLTLIVLSCSLACAIIYLTQIYTYLKTTGNQVFPNRRLVWALADESWVAWRKKSWSSVFPAKEWTRNRVRRKHRKVKVVTCRKPMGAGTEDGARSWTPSAQRTSYHAQTDKYFNHCPGAPLAPHAFF